MIKTIGLLALMACFCASAETLDEIVDSKINTAIGPVQTEINAGNQKNLSQDQRMDLIEQRLGVLEADGTVDPVDSDGDGVNDDVDQCPGTTQGVEVDAVGCETIPPDADGDGIPDAEDKCPNDATNTCNNPPGAGAFADCLTYFETNSGWCKLSDHTLSEVLHTRAEVGDGIWGWSGSKSVTNAWNGMAIDESSNTLYFTGNGHTDYLGTELYSYSLDTGLFERLTTAAPLDFYIEQNGVYALVPDLRKYAATHHTYDGVLFVPDTGTILVSILGLGVDYLTTKTAVEPVGLTKLELTDIGGVYEINPSKTETRNGLAPMDSRKVSARRFEGARTAIANGQIIIGSKTQLFEATLTASGLDISPSPKYTNLQQGDGNLVYSNGKLISYVAYGWGMLLEWDLAGGAPIRTDLTSPEGNAIAGGSTLLTWAGRNNIAKLSQSGVELIEHTSGPGNTPYYIYSKWSYLPAHDVYVGVGCANCPVYLYKYAPGTAQAMSASPAQQFVDAKTKIPKGNYASGLALSGDITVDLTDVKIFNGVQGKGLIVVNNGPATISNAVLDHRYQCSGCGAIRGQYHPNITIKDSYIANQENGVLTGNDGGILRIENSVIENNYTAYEPGQSHNVYAGTSEEFWFINSKSGCYKNKGHSLKSRAAKNYIHGSTIDQGDCNNSRLFDFSCGGYIEIKDSVMVQSPNSDNQDLISIAVESCAVPESTLVLEGTHWTANRANASFLTTKKVVNIECIGTNTFIGVASPCTGDQI